MKWLTAWDLYEPVSMQSVRSRHDIGDPFDSVLVVYTPATDLRMTAFFDCLSLCEDDFPVPGVRSDGIALEKSAGEDLQ
jgi:hypothetical protein